MTKSKGHNDYMKQNSRLYLHAYFQGVGHAQIFVGGITVDLYVTHTIAWEENAWYREQQVHESYLILNPNY